MRAAALRPRRPHAPVRAVRRGPARDLRAACPCARPTAADCGRARPPRRYPHDPEADPRAARRALDPPGALPRDDRGAPRRRRAGLRRGRAAREHDLVHRGHPARARRPARSPPTSAAARAPTQLNHLVGAARRPRRRARPRLPVRARAAPSQIDWREPGPPATARRPLAIPLSTAWPMLRLSTTTRSSGSAPGAPTAPDRRRHGRGAARACGRPRNGLASAGAGARPPPRRRERPSRRPRAHAAPPLEPAGAPASRRRRAPRRGRRGGRSRTTWQTMEQFLHANAEVMERLPGGAARDRGEQARRPLLGDDRRLRARSRARRPAGRRPAERPLPARPHARAGASRAPTRSCTRSR